MLATPAQRTRCPSALMYPHQLLVGSGLHKTRQSQCPPLLRNKDCPIGVPEEQQFCSHGLSLRKL
eukprot:3979044-Amphidinium_carterae.1